MTERMSDEKWEAATLGHRLANQIPKDERNQLERAYIAVYEEAKRAREELDDIGSGVIAYYDKDGHFVDCLDEETSPPLEPNGGQIEGP